MKSENTVIQSNKHRKKTLSLLLIERDSPSVKLALPSGSASPPVLWASRRKTASDHRCSSSGSHLHRTTYWCDISGNRIRYRDKRELLFLHTSNIIDNTKTKNKRRKREDRNSCKVSGVTLTLKRWWRDAGALCPSKGTVDGPSSATPTNPSSSSTISDSAQILKTSSNNSNNHSWGVKRQRNSSAVVVVKKPSGKSMGQSFGMCKLKRYKQNRCLHLRSGGGGSDDCRMPAEGTAAAASTVVPDHSANHHQRHHSTATSTTGIGQKQQQQHNNNNHHPHLHYHHSNATNPASGGGGGGGGYDPEYARMESWLDEHPDFVQDYFIRKGTRQVVDSWLVTHATSSTGGVVDVSSPTHNPQSSRASSGATTPVRKISAHEFERGGLLKPMISTVDGQPTFLTGTADTCQTGGGTGGNTGTGSPIAGRRQRRSRHELRHLDEKELIFELVKDICNELEVRSLCHKILQNVSTLLHADRGSLFLVQGERGGGCTPLFPSAKQNGRNGDDKMALEKMALPRGRCLVSKLFDVCPRSTVSEMENKDEIRIPWGTGIVGYVAESGEPVNIPDAYQDGRFNHDIDTLTGYRTKTLLCMPIKDTNGDVIGVAQVINKLGDQPFTKQDEEVFASYLQFCGIGLRNAHLYEKSQLEVKRNQVLLDLARMIFEEQSTIEHVVYRILTHTQSLIQCQRVQVLLVHQGSKISFSRVFDFEAKDLCDDDRRSPFESRFPINVGITGFVATTGETVNIPNAYEDERFDASVDEATGFKHKTILCMAIKNSTGEIIGVIQLINKFNDLPFTKNDENFVEAFAIFCGMGIHNTHMYERAVVAIAKQSVTLEVLSYHATASIEDAQKLRSLRVPSSAQFRLHDFTFDDIRLEDDETLTACIRMFLDLDLVEHFHMDYEVLCRWLCSVKKNYRNVTYHNWRHAFNVAQMMFAILTATQWWNVFGEIECLALMIACLCHDLDHRGTNNSFQIKASSPLAQLYSTSTMEHHHFDQCLMILNSPGNQLLANVSSEEYSRIVKVLEDAILSTDLAVYFRNRGAFFGIVRDGPTWCLDEHRDLLRAMLMTVCDLAAITKPWEVEKRVADLVSAEFFQQGDIEREKLNITPMDLMNREKKDLLPLLQVNFINSICLPIYEAFAKLSDQLEVLVDGVRENREKWLEIAAKQCKSEKRDTNDNLSGPAESINQISSD